MTRVPVRLPPGDTICGACKREFPTLADVFSHPCAESDRIAREKVEQAQAEMRAIVNTRSEPPADPRAEVRVLLTRHRGHPTAERVRILLNEARTSGQLSDTVIGRALAALQSISTPTADEGNTDAPHHRGRTSR